MGVSAAQTRRRRTPCGCCSNGAARPSSPSSSTAPPCRRPGPRRRQHTELRRSSGENGNIDTSPAKAFTPNCKKYPTLLRCSRDPQHLRNTSNQPQRHHHCHNRRQHQPQQQPQLHQPGTIPIPKTGTPPQTPRTANPTTTPILRQPKTTCLANRGPEGAVEKNDSLIIMPDISKAPLALACFRFLLPREIGVCGQRVSRHFIPFKKPPYSMHVVFIGVCMQRDTHNLQVGFGVRGDALWR